MLKQRRVPTGKVTLKRDIEKRLLVDFFSKVPIKNSECSEIAHRVGHGVLHRGDQMHGALPIQSGERHNMILWMRSSQIRNTCCPMCGEIPDLINVPGRGDGFTVPTVSVCSTS